MSNNTATTTRRNRRNRTDAASETTDAPVATTDAPTFPCSIVRPSARGDWYATVHVDAFTTDDGNDASGAYATVINNDVRVRFGGRGGAMIAAVPDDGRRAVVVVASVRAMRETDASGAYVNDARPGAIPSTVVAIGSGIASSITDGARIRATVGRVPASRRVATVAHNAASWANETGGTAAAFTTETVDAPDA